MNTSQTTLEWEANNVNHDPINLNMASFNLNEFHRHVYQDILRIVISDGRIDSAVTFTAFSWIILLVNYLPPSLRLFF